VKNTERACFSLFCPNFILSFRNQNKNKNLRTMRHKIHPVYNIITIAFITDYISGKKNANVY